MNKGYAYKHFDLPSKIRILSITLLLVLSGGNRPVEAGLWDEIREWYTSFRLGQYSEGKIPATPVEFSGEAKIALREHIELEFDANTPGIGHVLWMGFSPEGTLLITDFVGRQALEYSSDGRYIRSFGSRGKGPGEYYSPRNMAVDSKGQVYLLDTAWGQIIRYDRDGEYLDRTRSFKNSWILTGRKGEVFLVKVNPMKIIEVRRLNPDTWDVLYRIPVSTREQDFISFRKHGYSRLAYSTSRHRLYFIGPNDYLVKELNADTGQLVRQFGHRPDRYAPLPKRFQGIGRGSIENVLELDKTSSVVSAMVLVQDQYLIVCQEHPADSPDVWHGLIYDLTTSDPIKTYSFTVPAKGPQSLDIGDSYVKAGSDLATWKGRLYKWIPPSTKTAETSNGTIVVYEMSINGD